MFNPVSNAMCNNAAFSFATILGMPTETLHPTYERLLQALCEVIKSRDATSEVRPSDLGTTDVGKLLNTIAQTANNWKTRGVSGDAMLLANELYGIRVAYLRQGKEPIFAETYQREANQLIEALMKTWWTGSGNRRTSPHPRPPLGEKERRKQMLETDNFAGKPPKGGS